MKLEVLIAYQQAEKIIFIARAFNSVRYRSILIGSEEVLIRELFPAINITPAQLAHIFAYKPTDSESYDGLGSMGGEDAFGLLATLLNKQIEVVAMDGMSNVLGRYDVSPLTATAAAEASARWTRHVMASEQELRDIQQAHKQRNPKWRRILRRCIGRPAFSYPK